MRHIVRSIPAILRMNSEKPAFIVTRVQDRTPNSSNQSAVNANPLFSPSKQLLQQAACNLKVWSILGPIEYCVLDTAADNKAESILFVGRGSMNCPICGAAAVFHDFRMVCPNGHQDVSNPTTNLVKLTQMQPDSDSIFSEPAFRDESLIATHCDSCAKPIEIPAFEYYNTLAVCRMIICDGCQVERLKKALPQFFRE